MHFSMFTETPAHKLTDITLGKPRFLGDQRSRKTAKESKQSRGQYAAQVGAIGVEEPLVPAPPVSFRDGVLTAVMPFRPPEIVVDYAKLCLNCKPIIVSCW